jgi:hypothetical protein
MTNQTRRRCRTILPEGIQCTRQALSGHERCYPHGRAHRRSQVPASQMACDIPLLDTHAAIQQVCTDITRGLFAGTLDPAVARVVISSLRIATATLPRPVSPRSTKKTGKEAAEPLQPVTEIVTSPEGEELAPSDEWNIPEEKKERPWSLSEYLFRAMHPEKANEPLPEEGYMNPEKPSTDTLRVNPDDPDSLNWVPTAESATDHASGHPGTAHSVVPNQPPALQKPQPGIIKELSAAAEHHQIWTPGVRLNGGGCLSANRDP